MKSIFYILRMNVCIRIRDSTKDQAMGESLKKAFGLRDWGLRINLVRVYGEWVTGTPFHGYICC